MRTETGVHVFKTFPEFSALSFADREAYELLISNYPAVSDISFISLMTWWSQLGYCRVAQLDGNLVISHWFPGFEEDSGLSLVGGNRVDESICAIFDWQKERGDAPRLVHVPEFVVYSMYYPEMYILAEERNHAEPLIPVSRFYPLEQANRHKRRRIRRFLARIDDARIELRSLDLSSWENKNKETLLHAIATWRQRGTINDFGQHERDSVALAVVNAEGLAAENICLYIDGELQAFLIYHMPADPRYVITNYLKFSYAIPYMYEFAFYKFAEWFAGKGVKYMNIDADAGVPAMRTVMIALEPSNFFRKYTLRPV